MPAKILCYTLKLSAYNQSNINADKIGAFVIPVPTICEQAKIVAVLDDMFSKERQAKEAAEAVLDQIEAMKKTILARAFREELGTNDPAEESGVELLKQAL